MGRFIWSQGHSKQATDKPHTFAHEWFSKDHAEPSKQALTDSVKGHSSFESGSGTNSPKAQARSRTNTVTSSFSVYARSVSDASNDMTSRPVSQQSFQVDGGMPMPVQERHEITAKSLLAKGTRILRRQGSKLNLLPSQMDERAHELPDAKVGEFSSPKLLQRQPTLNSKKGTQGLKRSISGPFAFQHLTHGDQSRFQSLDSVSKTDLTSDFIAVQSSQHPADEIRGIPVTDLPVNKDEPKIEIGLDEPASPTTDAIPLLPTTPPRPSPPPKDGLMSPYNPSDFRMSRSMENFSRPTRLSVTAFDISPKSASSNRLSVMNPVGQANISALVKPLPLLPDSQVVHAVSTKDDIALPLRTAPLPSPPKPVMEMVEEETTEENAELQSLSPRPLPPNLHIIPTEMSKQHKRRSQSSGEIRFDVLYPEVIKNAGEEASPKTRQRISIGVKPIDIKDWEDAIDYSWEHAAELEAEEDPFTSPMRLRQPSGISIPHENYLVVEQRSIDDASSSASTPLMMYAAGKSSQEEAPVSLQSRQVSPLMGLGIGALRPGSSVSLSDAAAISHDRRTSNFQPEEVGRSQTMRSPASVMSKSSSQESIIASIFGTQRSSNSSTSLSDFAHLASGSFGGSMEHLKLDLQDFTFTPTERHFREGSQDTIREDVEHTKSIEALADIGIISPFPNFTASPAVKHDRGMSASQVPIVPERKSSMPGATDTSRTPAGRKRSNTASSRSRRNTRVSYSLFPAPATN